MTATVMSSCWLQRKRAVDADESGWGEEEGRRARQRMMDVGRRRTTTTTTTKTQQSKIEREREKKDGGDGDFHVKIVLTTHARGHAITCTFLSVDVNGDDTTGYDNNDGDGATDNNRDGATDDDVRRDGR